MRILITTEFYLPFCCGVTTAVENEIKALEADGDSVRVLTIGEGRESFFDRVTKCWYIRSNFPWLYKDSFASLALNDPILQEIYDWKPEIIHSQSEFFSFLFAKKISKKLSVPIVHTCHTDFEAYAIHFTSHTRIWGWGSSVVVPLLIRKASRLICSTDKIHSLISSYGIKKPIDRIMIGLDSSSFTGELEKEERDEMRAALSISPEETVFVSVSRLSEEKSVDEVIRLFSLLSEKEEGLKLLIVGDGSAREGLENLAKEMNAQGRIVFAGLVDPREVWKYYRLGDIYIGASLSETQCLSYLEAMASSLPLLVKEDPVLKGYLAEGINGMTFKGMDDFMLKAHHLISSRELRKKYGEAARHEAERFSLPAFAKNLKKSFRLALEEKRNGEK